MYFISARGSHLQQVTEEWFLENALEFDHIELIGNHDKIEAAKKYEVDIFLEDKHDNAVMIHEACGIPVILFDTPYNQDPLPNGVIRVRNWIEANAWAEDWLQKEAWKNSSMLLCLFLIKNTPDISHIFQTYALKHHSPLDFPALVSWDRLQFLSSSRNPGI